MPKESPAPCCGCEASRRAPHGDLPAARTLARAQLGLPTKRDQERTLHLLNQLQSRLMDLEEKLETRGPEVARSEPTGELQRMPTPGDQ